MKTYLFNVALSIDLLGSAILGGIPGETMSGRAGAAQAAGKLRGKILAPLINLIMWNRNHCKSAVQGDINRAKAVLADDIRT